MVLHDAGKSEPAAQRIPPAGLRTQTIAQRAGGQKSERQRGHVDAHMIDAR